jgi:hypothetical protein
MSLGTISGLRPGCNNRSALEASESFLREPQIVMACVVHRITDPFDVSVRLLDMMLSIRLSITTSRENAVFIFGFHPFQREEKDQRSLFRLIPQWMRMRVKFHTAQIRERAEKRRETLHGNKGRGNRDIYRLITYRMLRQFSL